MEPTKELNLEAQSPPSPVTLDLDTDFCDCLLNPVPDAVWKPHDPTVLDMECVSLYDSCNMDSADLDSIDLDCLDLECFLSAPVPLAC